ncbi:MAG TPA: ubiquinone/menaquinone biosynthesis methyltransferase [Actinomycetota bacterium]|jgi:demethylmenaquinone methyltransferase/2-methoxy-6-polyprenyl-1,4-benzoquinol methylase|nr:ubiquinone/menaquinone biosynthesis methyltransferase [Actinomycetota bacterium]
MSAPDELPTGPEKARAVRGMFDRISGRYDLVNRVMTFGMDVGWRRRTVRELRLPGRALVADLACGTGDLCGELASAGYRAVGVDFSYGMLSTATAAAPLVQADVLRLPFADGAIDGATCGFALRNVVTLPHLFSETARVLRAGGRAAFLEAAEPEGAVMRAGHSLYFNRIVPLIGGVLSDREAYRYLPRSMAYLPSVPELVTMLEDAGFVAVERIPLSGGIAQLIVGTRR